MPSVTCKRSCRLLPASGSATEIALLFAVERTSGVSRGVLTSAGFVITGGSLMSTGVRTLMNVRSVSLLPSGSVILTSITEGPSKSVGAVKIMPSRAVLMSTRVPLKVIVPSLVPSPTVNVRPVTPDSVRLPMLVEIIRVPSVLSGSETEIKLSLSVLKVIGILTSVVSDSGASARGG